MTTFTYVIQDPLGIHARPAGQLAKTAATFADCDIKVSANGQTADAKRIMGLMKLGAKQGHTLTITCEGGDEAAAAVGMEAFLKENL